MYVLRYNFQMIVKHVVLFPEPVSPRPYKYATQILSVSSALMQ